MSISAGWPILTVKHLQFLKCFLYGEIKIIPAVDLQSADALIPHCFHPWVAVHLACMCPKRGQTHQVTRSWSPLGRFTSASKSDGEVKEVEIGGRRLRKRCHRKAPPRGRDEPLAARSNMGKLLGGNFTPFFWDVYRLFPGGVIPRCAKESHTLIISLNELAHSSSPPAWQPRVRYER